MPEQNGNTTNGASRSTLTAEEKPALDTALQQIDAIKTGFRDGIAGLNKLGDLLRQAQRDHKSSDREIQSARQTLRSLQSVRI